MITGVVTNVIAFNGAALSYQPSEHGWVERDQLGVDGNGIAVYPAVRSYELRWDALEIDAWNEIYAFFLSQGITGTVTSTLPKWNGVNYQFQNYSGTILREMTYEGWFMNWYKGVRLVITRIVT